MVKKSVVFRFVSNIMPKFLLGFLLVVNELAKDIMAQKHRTNNFDEKFAASLGSCNVEIDEPCSSDKIIFYLYTTNSVEDSIELSAVDPNLSLHYNVTRHTKIIIHGYVGNVDSKDSAFLRTVYLQENNFNLIVVDWGELVRHPCYPTAVFSTWQAGKCVAVFLENFVKNRNFRKVHIIGFSLGAHAASFASNHLEKKLKRRLGRITGLDPALPFFASLETTMKLDEEDADFVDVIHTNIGIFGKIEPTGHVDFYVNGGFYQPACQMAPNIPLCSHLMATVYFAESVAVNREGFWGVPCSSHFQYLIGACNNYKKEDRVLMGEKCDSRSRGVYFVKTRSQSPYGLG